MVKCIITIIVNVEDKKAELRRNVTSRLSQQTRLSRNTIPFVHLISSVSSVRSTSEIIPERNDGCV